MSLLRTLQILDQNHQTLDAHRRNVRNRQSTSNSSSNNTDDRVYHTTSVTNITLGPAFKDLGKLIVSNALTIATVTVAIAAALNAKSKKNN